MESTLLDKTFRDSEGKIVIAQPPNLPILVWVGVTLLQLVIADGQAHSVLNLIAFGALFTWAWEEIFQGVNYFRRALGLLTMVGLILFKVQGL